MAYWSLGDVEFRIMTPAFAQPDVFACEATRAIMRRRCRKWLIVRSRIGRTVPQISLPIAGDRENARVRNCNRRTRRRVESQANILRLPRSWGRWNNAGRDHRRSADVPGACADGSDFVIIKLVGGGRRIGEGGRRRRGDRAEIDAIGRTLVFVTERARLGVPLEQNLIGSPAWYLP